jgi:YcaO-like protein with predicted kinase domain
VLGDLFIVEGRRREDVEIFQATALQQFGDRTGSLGGKYPVICVVLFNPANGTCFASFGAHPDFGVALEWAPKEAKQVPFAGLNSTTQITGYLPPSEPS